MQLTIAEIEGYVRAAETCNMRMLSAELHGEFMKVMQPMMMIKLYATTAQEKIAAAALRIDRDEAPTLSGSGGAGRPQPANIVEIPKKYNVDTELTAEVTAEGKQTINFDLD